MSVMRNIVSLNSELTEAIFWVCCAVIVGSLVRIIMSIW